MRHFTVICLFFCWFASCHAPGKEPRSLDPSGRLSAQPYDPHAHLVLTRHARCRMDCRHITTKEIHEILDSGTINYSKSEPDARPDPKYAVEGYTSERQHLRIILAPEGDKLVIITCIELGVEWACSCN
jgi:Domain of unknown function (DUF4258)